jgi:hypothetical protein
LAGLPIAAAEAHVRRYCGLVTDDHPPQVWAYAYFDSIPTTNDDEVSPTDVVACSALHPGLNRADLEFFHEATPFLRRCLGELPDDIDLADAEGTTLDAVKALGSLKVPVRLSLLSKVLHRKRPRLIPMWDRSLMDWYRWETGVKGEEAWPSVVEAFSADLGAASNREELERIRRAIWTEVSPVPTLLRIADIAVWMEQLR